MVTFDPRTRSLHCTGCLTDTPVRRRTFEDPEGYVEFLEMVVLDHMECENYGDIKRAELARRYRKEVKRLMLLTPARA